MAEARTIIISDREINRLAMQRSPRVGEIIMGLLIKTGSRVDAFNVVPRFDGVTTEINVFGGAR